MKPENILVCDDGHLKLTDFGLAKMGITEMYGTGDPDTMGVTKSLVGTPEYLAPEIISSKPYGKAADWWTIGILTFELMVGKTPFIKHNISRSDMFKLIRAGQFEFPSTMQIPPAAQDFIASLVVADPSQRLGSICSQDIKDHQFFTSYLNVNFEDLENRKVIPPWTPQNKSINDNVSPTVQGAINVNDFAKDTGAALTADEQAVMEGFAFVSVSPHDLHDHGVDF